MSAALKAALTENPSPNLHSQPPNSQPVLDGRQNRGPLLFVSYSRVDQWVTEKIARRLRQAYDRVWFDENLYGGQVWWDTILKRIDECDIFIYLLSRDSVESPYCRSGIREAKRLGKKTLPC
jgi:hypothetical protein